MVAHDMMRQRTDMAAFSLLLLGLVGSLRAEGITPSTPKSPPAALRTLFFPCSPCVGNLYLELVKSAEKGARRRAQKGAT